MQSTLDQLRNSMPDEPVDTKTGFVKANWLVGVLVGIVCVLGTVAWNDRKDADSQFNIRISQLEQWRMQRAESGGGWADNKAKVNAELASLKKDIEVLTEKVKELKDELRNKH